MGVIPTKELRDLSEQIQILDTTLKTMKGSLDGTTGSLDKLEIEDLNSKMGNLNLYLKDLTEKVDTLDGGVVALNDRMDVLNLGLGNLATVLGDLVRFLASLGPIFDVLGRLLEKAHGPVDSVIAVEGLVSKVITAPLNLFKTGIETLNKTINSFNLKIGK